MKCPECNGKGWVWVYEKGKRFKTMCVGCDNGTMDERAHTGEALPELEEDERDGKLYPTGGK